MKVRRHLEAIFIICVLSLVTFYFWQSRLGQKRNSDLGAGNYSDENQRNGGKAEAGAGSGGGAEGKTLPGSLRALGGQSIFEIFPSGMGIKTIKNEPVEPLISALGSNGPHVLIVHHWATWCAPCVTEIPSLSALAAYLGKRAIFLAISGDSDAREIEIFLKSFKELNSPYIKIIHDADNSLRSRMGVKKLPETYIYNSKGALIKKISGSEKWDTPEAKEYFELLLK